MMSTEVLFGPVSNTTSLVVSPLRRLPAALGSCTGDAGGGCPYIPAQEVQRSGISLAAHCPGNMMNGWNTLRFRTFGPNITYDGLCADLPPLASGITYAMSSFDVVDGSPSRRQLLLPADDGGERPERQLLGEVPPDQQGRSDLQLLSDPAIRNNAGRARRRGLKLPVVIKPGEA